MAGEEEWEEPYEWSPRELITAAKLNITTKNLRWLKQRLEEAAIGIHDKTAHRSPTLPDDDIHRTAIPLDHPDSSITPPKLAAINTPEDGQVPSFHAATGQFQWVPVGPAVPAPGLRKIVEIVVPEDCTDVNITGLNLNAHKFYWIQLFLRNVSGYSTYYNLYPNGLTQYAHYSTAIWSTGTTVYTFSSSYPRVAAVAGQAQCVADIVIGSSPLWIGWPHNRPVMVSRSGETGVGVLFLSMVRTGPSIENLTSLLLMAETANAIGQESRILIWGVVE